MNDFERTTRKSGRAGAVAVSLWCAAAAQAITINVPADKATIQDAIIVAVNGDIIAVAPGTYNETIDFQGKEISVKSTSGDPLDTIIDGGGAGPVVTMTNGETIDSLLSGFTVTGGFAIGAGGGIEINNGAATIDNCHIVGNEVTTVGAGAFVQSGPGSLFINCRFDGNISGGAGAGTYVNVGGFATFDRCEFVGNQGSNVLFCNQGLMLVSRSSIHDNDVVTAVNDLNAQTQISNSAFYDNFGADPIARASGTTKFANCTFAKHVGAAVEASGGGSINVVNSILYGLGAGEVSGAGVNIEYSNVRGGSPGDGNIDANPEYVDFLGDDYHLSWTSPCIDAADADQLPAGEDVEDIEGNDRLVNNYAVTDTGTGSVSYLDMGAYEGASPVRFVKWDAIGANDGTSWDDAYTELKVALDDAALADDVLELWVGGGTYKADLLSGDRSASFELADGVSMYGGFNGTESDRGDRNPDVNPVTLGGAIGADGTADNTYRLVTGVNIGSDTRIEGFIMQKANADGGGSQNEGAAVHLTDSSPIFVDCIFRLNEANGQGPAVYAAGGSPRFRRCRTNLNVGSLSTMYFDGGSPRLDNCLLHGNEATSGGSAIYFNQCTDAEMINSTVWGNHTASWAAGIFNFDGSLILANNISWGNTRDNETTGIPMSANLHGTLGIIDGYHNTIGEYTPAGFFGDDLANHGYDPNFVDADGVDNVIGTIDDNLALSANSRSIDSGDNDFVGVNMEFDFLGLPRMLDDSGMPDSGNGTAPIVDRGVAEFAGTSCLADIDGSGDVGFGDLLTLLAQWGDCPGCSADLDLDDDVDFSDLVSMLAAWGPC